MVVAVDALRVAYSPVPKAGCSSVKGMLADLDPAVTVPDPGDYTDPLLHGNYQTRRFRGDRWSNVQDYFGFTVVRDPLKRLLSLYTDRIIKRRDLARCKTILRGQVDLAIDPDPDYFFENFDAYLRASSVVKHHGLPMEVFTGTDLSVYDRIYRIEELGALAKDLGKVTGKTPTLKRRNQSKSKLDFSDLGKQAKEVLRQRLTPEYEHLSEFYPVPF